jgi:hypothetical protein
MIAMLYGAMVTALLLPAYGQEIDPTWYDPWAAPNTAIVLTSQPQAAVGRHRAALKSVSTVRTAGKLRAKRSATRQRPS